MGVSEFSSKLAQFNQDQLNAIQAAVTSVGLSVNQVQTLVDAIKNTDVAGVSNKIGTSADGVAIATLFGKLAKIISDTSGLGAKILDYRLATPYQKARKYTLTASQTLNLLNITGKGYIRGILLVTSSANTGTWELKITIDGVAESWTTTVANNIGMYWLVPNSSTLGLNIGGVNSGATIAFEDRASNRASRVHPLMGDLFFSTSLKIDIIAPAGSSGWDVGGFYDVGVFP